MRDRVIVCCTPFGESWKFFAQELTAPDVRWIFFSDRARYFWQRFLQHPNLNTPVAGLRAALSAKWSGARLLISLDARLSFWCSLFCRLLRVDIDHLGFSFNFAELPRGWKKRLFSYAFRNMGSIWVHSRMEVALYSEYFGIPKERIHVGLLCMNPPEVSPEVPLCKQPYVCAIGGNARDYRTLLLASEKTPEIPMVWVVRPGNVAGMTVPDHVQLVCNVPLGEAMNYLKYSQFMVLPLKSSETPCGHVTIVAAMFLSKAILATDSAGISDYIQENQTGVLCRPADADDLAAKMRRLWTDLLWADELGVAGLRFAEEHLLEEQLRGQMADFLRDRDLLRDERQQAEPSDELMMHSNLR